MTIRDAADEIKRTVSSADVVALYGYKPDRGGYIGCPFHGEKTPSLRLHKSGWYCYGCHQGGSVIDFVMRHEDCTFVAAVKAIDRHMHLGLIDDGPKSLQKAMQERQERQVWERARADRIAALEADIRHKDEEQSMWWVIYQSVFATPQEERTAQQWFDMAEAKAYCESIEDEKQQLRLRLEEVRAWRMPSKAHSD